MPDALEHAEIVLEPYWHAVRDTYVEYVVDERHPCLCDRRKRSRRTSSCLRHLERLRSTRVVIVAGVHDTDRHYARCREDGMLIELAPECVDLSLEHFLPIMAHEFGHAADFAYPAHWVAPDGPRGAAMWISEEQLATRHAQRWRRLWHERDDAQVEWSADAIARAVTGQDITYAGPCMLQCFSPHGMRRPPNLR